MTVTKADPGPAVFRDWRLTRGFGIRGMAKVLAFVPWLPYQLIFRLELRNHP